MKNYAKIILNNLFILVLCFLVPVVVTNANEVPESEAYLKTICFDSDSFALMGSDDFSEEMADENYILTYIIKDYSKRVFIQSAVSTKTLKVIPTYSEGATCKIDGVEYNQADPSKAPTFSTGDRAWTKIEIISKDGTNTNTYYILQANKNGKKPQYNYWNILPSKTAKLTISDKGALEVIKKEFENPSATYTITDAEREQGKTNIDSAIARITELEVENFGKLVAELKGDGTDSDDAIAAAKQAYEDLSPEAKELAKADNEKLVAAEKAVADKKAEEVAKPTETPTPTQPTTPKATTPAVKKGTAFKVGKNYYKVTKVTKRTGTATFTKASSKKLTAVSIPATVKYKGYTFKVTVIQKNALKGYKKLKTVTVGKNVTTIGASAFAGDAKLKKITVKSAVLKKVAAKALKGVNKKAVIKVPKKQLKKYTKLFKGKGQKKTVKVK